MVRTVRELKTGFKLVDARAASFIFTEIASQPTAHYAMN